MDEERYTISHYNGQSICQISGDIVDWNFLLHNLRG